MTNGIAVHKLTRAAHSKILCILGLLEGHNDLTNRDRDMEEQTVGIIDKSKIGCPVANFVGV